MKGRWNRRGVAVLGVGLLLTGAAAALSQGDSLISLSYLKENFIPTMVAQGAADGQSKLDAVYQTALDELDKADQQTSGGMGDELYSEDLRSRGFARGDSLTLNTGSGFLLYAGQASVSHNGAVIDVTDGMEVPSGSGLQKGHRYLVGENTTAAVTARSGLMKGGVQGSYTWSQSGTQAAPFVDVSEGDWYSVAVDYAYFNGLFAGMGEDQFVPTGSMDRSMMMTVLYHLAGSPEDERLSATATFADVPADQWYYTFVSWAAEQGVSAGTGDGKFSPKQPVTREQVVVLLYNFAVNYMGIELKDRADITTCADYDQISFWSVDVMSWAVASGIMTPDANTQLQPLRSATRAEVASMLMKFSQRYL